jgi:hypothetical protein
MLLHPFHEPLLQCLDVLLHIVELPLHAQDDFHASQVDTAIACQMEDKTDLLNVLRGLQARIPFGT